MAASTNRHPHRNSSREAANGRAAAGIRTTITTPPPRLGEVASSAQTARGDQLHRCSVQPPVAHQPHRRPRHHRRRAVQASAHPRSHSHLHSFSSNSNSSRRAIVTQTRLRGSTLHQTAAAVDMATAIRRPLSRAALAFPPHRRSAPMRRPSAPRAPSTAPLATTTVTGMATATDSHSTSLEETHLTPPQTYYTLQIVVLATRATLATTETAVVVPPPPRLR